MEIITAPLAFSPGVPLVAAVDIPVDRHTLAKRRWRGVATNGREFGFDLEHSLTHGEVVWVDEMTLYRVFQKPESVLEIALTGASATDAARLGWLLGNLHFRIAVAGEAIHAPDDPAIRQLLEREHIHFQVIEAVFQPMSGGHSHGH